MEGGEHSSVELTVAVKVPCQECGGRGYVETVTEGGRITRDTTEECLTCSGRGLIPEDMPLSQFQALLASQIR
jgi:DnaJ-class molecular chaperone